MTNEQKAMLYDDLIRESDRIQRITSKLNSEYPINQPEHVQKQIEENKRLIDNLVVRLNNLMS